ncbi:uncharacterized protein LOC112495183 isoform X2 [Cephus cinctus]|uniref:Uncharacterized protein LOC112495183 isoform X2 n=1 Tax=Cephus cinctus TaxID=211228 RepID=A0AAJ7RSQ4_CEPCN|nr:uncharacterized protein LOC112495183 isoform X2 [Cephus cinctus]XP_024946420.1 uncharacterized protein LOC112495183 isoform X2 [Cephus cinctus]
MPNFVPLRISRISNWNIYQRDFILRNVSNCWDGKGQSPCLDKLEEWKDKNGMDQYAGNRLKLVLQKLGRPDLVAYLKKTYPNFKSKESKMIASREIKSRETRDLGIKDNVASLNSGGFIQAFQDGDNENVSYILGPEFTMYSVIGSLLILSCLGCVLVMSYRRVYNYYQCYMDHFKNKDEEKCMFDKTLSKFEISPQKELQNLEICEDCTTDNEKQDKEIDCENSKRNRRFSKNNNKMIKKNNHCKNIKQNLNKSNKINKTTRKISESIQNEKNMNVCKCSRSQKPEFISKLRKIIGGTIKKNSENHTSCTFIQYPLSKIENNLKSQEERNKGYRAGKMFRKKYLKRSRKSKLVQPSRKIISTEKINPCTCKMCKLFNINDEKYNEIHKLMME